MTSRLSGLFNRPAKIPMLPPLPAPAPIPAQSKARDPGPTAASAPSEILPPAERRAAMSGLNEVEVKWSKGGLILAAVLGAYLTYYLASHHTRQAKVHGHLVQVPISSSFLLLGGIVLAFCAIGFFGLYRRKRTLVAFAFFITGFSFTLIFAPLGFALVFLGGWLMLRAWRIQKYGTPSAKAAAGQAATRRPRREGKAAAGAPPKPSGHKAPTANKRYTPKAPPRKRVAKPTD